MNLNSMFETIKKYGILNKQGYFSEAFSRNIGLLTEEEQKKLSDVKVAIPGMGGVGGLHLITLIRTGIGKFNIADFDVYEPVNVNRQFGATVPAFGRSKVDVMREQALSINPYLELNLFQEGINQANLEHFLDGVDIVIDSLDFFEFDVRRLLFKKAADKGIYVITAGPLGFSSAMLIFDPNGMGFDEYFNIKDSMIGKDKYVSFALGLAPRPTHIKYMDLKKVDLESKAGPSLGIACQICSALAATEALKIVLNKGRTKAVPHYFQFDPYLQIMRQGYMSKGNKNPLQKIKIFVIKKMLRKNKPKLNRNKPNGSPQIKEPYFTDNFESGIPKEIINYIVELGTWAPSADNVQPWKFSWDGTKLMLLKDVEKANFFYDVNNESTHLTFGALMENISIAASHFGLNAEFNLFPSGYYSDIISEVQFFSGTEKEDELYPHVMTRRVNRAFYKNKKIQSEKVSTLKNIFHGDSNARLIWIDGVKDKKCFQQIIFDADRILFEDKRLHQGLFRWINLKGKFKDEGMNIDVLGLNMVQRALFPILSDWSKMKILNKVGVSRMAAFNSIQLLSSSPSYALITINNISPENYINGGRTMERFWIKANALGLSVHPMLGFIFLLNHLTTDGAKKFRPSHRKMIAGFQKKLSSIQGVNASDHCLAFFRLGVADKLSEKTLRQTPKFS